MGEFLNQYVTDLHVIIPLAIGAVFILIVFSILYNHWISVLGDRKEGYTAIIVVIGNLVTLLIVAVFSWKAAGIALLAFAASGTSMIIGDISRTTAHRQVVIAEIKKQVRRKPLPYVAGRLLADAIDDLNGAERKIEQIIETKKYELLPLVAMGISKALRYLIEANSTEGE